MLALIAGRGSLPQEVARAQRVPPLICALEGQDLDDIAPDVVFRLERLGGFLATLKARGVTQVCFCGAVKRPKLRAGKLDGRTLLMLPKILRGLRGGEDSALRLVIALFEAGGFEVKGAHDLAPDLLCSPGILAGTLPDGIAEIAELGDQISAQQSDADMGQSCVLRGADVMAREGAEGTDAMLSDLRGAAGGGIFYKACKVGQDRRIDMPVIGPSTVHGAAAAGLTGLIIEAGNVMMLDQDTLFDALSETGLFLWARPKPSQADLGKG